MAWDVGTELDCFIFDGTFDDQRETHPVEPLEFKPWNFPQMWGSSKD